MRFNGKPFLEFDFLRPAPLDEEVFVCTSVGYMGVHSVRLNLFVSSCTDERRKSVRTHLRN